MTERYTEPMTDIRGCADLVATIRLWHKTRDESGYTAKHPEWWKPPQVFAEMAKSRLLWWLLQGNDPLPDPPPLYLSGPQHELERDGVWDSFEPPVIRAKNPSTSDWFGPGGIDFGYIVPYWTLVAREGDDWIVSMPGRLSGTWRIKRAADTDVPHTGVGMVPTATWEARRITP